MQNNRLIIQYIAAAIVVVILGGFVGWYMYVRSQIDATESVDTARGVGVDVATGGELGSGISNISPTENPTGTQQPAVTPAREQPATSIGLWGRIKSLFSGGATSPGGTGSFSGGTFGTAPTAGSTFGGNIAQGNTTEQTTNAAPRLWQITRTPVAGLGFASSSRLYYAERASGNILIADPTRTDISRVTNTLFARTIEAIFASDGSVVLRSLGESGEIVSYAARIATSSSAAAGEAPGELEGVYLPRDIISIAGRSSPNTLFFVVPDTAGGAAGITTDWSGGNQRRSFSSAIMGWRTIVTSDGAQYVLQKASDDVHGHLFRVSTAGTLVRVITDLPGLVALPRTGGNAVLYSTSERGVVTLYTRVNGEDRQLQVRTIAEKCAWANGNALIAYCAVPKETPGGAYLRAWYSGAMHTDDALWRIDASTGSSERITLPDIGTALDMSRLQVDESGAYIAFQNALDGTLWMLSLNR